MPDVIIQEAHAVEMIQPMSNKAKMEIANKIGIQVDGLAAKDVTKLSGLMTKNKKAVNFVISFDGQWFGYYSQVGSTKENITELDVANYPGLDKEKILKGLVACGAATKAQVDAFRKANPDPKALEALKKEIGELEKKLEGLKKQYKDMGGT